MNVNLDKRIGNCQWQGKTLDTRTQDPKKSYQGIFDQYSLKFEELSPLDSPVTPPSLLEKAKNEIEQGRPFLEVIQEYKIADENEKVILAKLEAGIADSSIFKSKTSEHIHLYGITCEQARIEIAEIAAGACCWGTAQHFKNYGIIDERAQKRVAMAIAALSGVAISSKFTNFFLTNEKDRFEIAKVAAAKSGRGVSEYFKNYCLTDPAFIAEIADIASKKDPYWFSCYVKNFGFQDKKKIFELCERALFDLVKCFDVSQLRLEFYLDQWKGNLYFADYCSIASLLLTYPEINEKNKQLFVSAFSKMVIDKFPSFEKQILSLFNNIISTNTINWSAQASFFLLYETSESALKMLLETGLIEELANCHDPKMRHKLLRLVFQSIKDEHIKRIFEVKLTETKMPSNKKFYHGSFALYYSLLSQIGIDDATLDRINKYTHTGFYKTDIVKQRKILEALNILLEDMCLTPGQKIHLLQFLFPMGKEPAAVESYRQLQALIGLVGFRDLEVFKEDPKDLTVLLKESFEAIVPYGEVSGFGDKFKKKITDSRHPTAALIYAGVLNKLYNEERDEVLNAYGLFINHFLNGTYHQYRYNFAVQSVHLKSVFEGREVLFEKWRKGEEVSLDALLGERQKEKAYAYSFKKILYQKVIRDNHLNGKNFPLLVNYLEHPIQSPMECEYGSGSQKKEENDISGKESLLIALSSIDIDSKDKDFAENRVRKALAIIDKLLECEFPLQFLKDLEDMKKQSSALFISPESKGYRVVDTDDPEDMLLCGTEVTGSCQRVDGDPDMNKCLVAYLNDGKIRLIAIKKKDERIVARSILRIMLREDTQEPVLLLERLYPSGAPAEFETGIIAFAKKRGEELGLPLVSVEIKSDNKFGTAIKSLGSPAPYEYVDSCTGVEEKGEYRISPDSLYLLQDLIDRKEEKGTRTAEEF